MTKQINTKDGNHGVQFIENVDGQGSIMAVAVLNDGQSYGGSSYWFTIGTYKTMKSAIRYSAKRLQRHGYELEIA